MAKCLSLLLHVRLTQQPNTPVMMAISWTREMSNVPAKLGVFGVVKVLNAVSRIALHTCIVQCIATIYQERMSCKGASNCVSDVLGEVH